MKAYPNRNIPSAQTFIKVRRRLGEMGSFINTIANKGRPRYVRTVEMEERILEKAEVNPGISTQNIALEERIDTSSCWEVLHEDLLYPFHVQNPHAIMERQHQHRF